MKGAIVFETVYPHPPERIWRALTDPKALAEWLMENDFEPRVGHHFRFRAQPQPGWDGIVHCEVLEVDPPRRLRYTWAGGGNETVVTLTLAPVAEGTRLRLEHSGFQGLKGTLTKFILARGWRKKILRVALPRVLARLGDRAGAG